MSLALIRYVERRHRGGRVALYECSFCGFQKEIPCTRVQSGQLSCGCILTKHGHATGNGGKKTPEYTAWLAMRARVSAVEGQPDFECYAARGIGICDRWSSFDLFLADMGLRPDAKYSLGRIDNDKGYSPENCRWETAVEQMRNTRSSKRWFVRGREFPSCRAAGTAIGVDQKTIRYWVKTREDCYALPRY